MRRRKLPRSRAEWHEVKDFQPLIIMMARLLGWLVYHTYDSRRSQPGFPDLVLVRGTRLIFVELKRAKGKLTDAQEEWGAALQQTAAEYYVWRPDDLEEIEKILT